MIKEIVSMAIAFGSGDDYESVFWIEEQENKVSVLHVNLDKETATDLCLTLLDKLRINKEELNV